MAIQALIFDYNGVLVDDVKIHIEAYYRAALEMGYPITAETVKKYISYSPTEKRIHYLGDVSIEEWNNYMKVKGKHYFKAVAERDVVFDTVRTTLPSLARKYSLALVSNTPREYFERVFPAPLAGLFKITLFADEVRKPKPDPEPLLTILSRLGLEKEQCRYIGDSIVDVRMARLVGVPIFAVATGDASYQELVDAKADAVLNDLNGLESQLEGSSF